MSALSATSPNVVILATLIAAAGLSSSNALADDVCPTGYGDYDDCGGICTLSGTTWTCDISYSEAAAEAVVVSDWDTSAGHEFEAWGTIFQDETEKKFCCTIDSDGTIDTIIITGSAYADTLKFTWEGATYNLTNLPLGTLAAQIDGGDGDDVIQGSNDWSSAFIETLNGDGDDDIIFGYGGEDVLNGGAGQDMLMGGDGSDTMDGGANGDYMQGSGGHDVMNGGDGGDRMSGGAGDDTMDGGAGNDIMCGDDQPNEDTLDDGDTDSGVDALWSSEAADTVTCGNTSTYWDGNAGGSCGSTNFLTSPRPSLCPDP